jgi:hypothetical protein
MLKAMENKFPKTITFNGENLIKMRSEIDLDSALVQNFKKKADLLLDARPYNVVARTLKAISGNPHDYMSMGPYWWPNPNTENGLPYIRRDGEINPETRNEDNYSSMCDRVFNMALAAFLFEDKKYGEKAEQFLKAWHLDEDTYMNPHLEYGQSIPGICTGRGIGLIDTSGSYRIFDAIAILEYMGYISEDTVNGIKDWYNKFVNWMLTSEKGIDEDVAHNNHGAWFDVQIASAALFTGRKSLATKTLNLAYDRRIKAHIKEDGSQPAELARTKGMHYSFYNLKALMLLASMADKVKRNVDYWGDTDTGAALLRRAIDYLYPYACDLSTFPYQEISKSVPKSSMGEALMYAEARYPGNGYAEKAEEFTDDTMFWQLYPRA